MNPSYAINVNTISSRAPSTTQPTLHQPVAIAYPQRSIIYTLFHFLSSLRQNFSKDFFMTSENTSGGTEKPSVRKLSVPPPRYVLLGVQQSCHIIIGNSRCTDGGLGGNRSAGEGFYIVAGNRGRGQTNKGAGERFLADSCAQTGGASH